MSTAFKVPLFNTLFLKARNFDVLRSAKSRTAWLLRIEGLSGCVAACAFADLLLVGSNPRSGPGLPAQPGGLSLVTQAGRVVRGQS